MQAVEAIGLVKRFGQTEALRGVDLAVERATVLGLLGPNGAGKTTAVRILTTLLKPDAGQAFIDGIDVLKQPRRARARIGLTGQYAAVDERLTGLENLVHVGRLFHQDKRVARLRADELLERFDLVPAADRAARTYSGGMRRRLDIAMSLIADPSVLFLDEPTTGLDPRSRIAMWDFIDELVARGTTSCSPRSTSTKPTASRTRSRSSTTAGSSSGERPTTSSVASVASRSKSC
jgi:ABC-2 type transport system ATP-binding protein